MRALLLILTSIFLLVAVFAPHQLAQSNQHNEVDSGQFHVERANYRSSRIEPSVEEIARLSEVNVVSTVVENGNAYAIGLMSDGFFKTKVWDGASQAFGISAGKLVFSAPKQSSVYEELFIVDLRNNVAESLFPDHSTVRAEWQPNGRTLSAIVSRGDDVGLLLYDLNSGRVETLRQEFIDPSFLRWSDNGDMLYFIEVEESEQDRYLVRLSLSTSIEARTRVESQIPFLWAASDSSLQSDDLRVTESSYSTLDDKIAIKPNSDGSMDLELQREGQVSHIVKNAVPIRRVEGGLLFEFSDSIGTDLAVWDSKSGEIFLLTESGYVPAGQVTTTAEIGLIGAWYLNFPLSGQSSTSATINTIFDHSMTGSYADDNITVAYTGEKGDSRYGRSLVWGTHYGFMNASRSDFIVNGHYAGGGNTKYLYYDGHPGLDYRAAETTQVYAPAAGTIVQIQDSYNTFYIDHGNGYRSYILHTGTRRTDGTWGRNNVTGDVKRNDPIAEVGGAGGFPPHLHYELRKKVGSSWIPVDPYGWAGGCPDPYTAAVSVNLWTNSGTQWNFSIIGNTQGWAPRNVECFSVHDGIFFIDPKAVDPFIEGPPLVNVNASNFNAVEVRLASNAPDGSGSVYFATTSPPNWDANKSVDFTVTNDGNFRTYTVPMDGNSLWSGAITAIRVDPSGAGLLGTNSDTVGFDFVKLTNTTGGGGTPVISVTPSSQDFGSVQIGSAVDRSFTVQNVGSGTLSGSASVPTPFSIISGASYNLSAGQTQTVTVRFTPTAVQSYSQYVTFSGGGTANRAVVGTGTGAGSQPAQITSPTPGSTLGGSIVTFAWNAGSNVTQYWLYVGTSLGGSDIYNANQGTSRSATVTNIPIDGRTIYVRLWSYIGGWQWNDYTYLAVSGGGGTPAISVTPASLNFGSLPVGSSANLNFSVQNIGSGTLSGGASVTAPFSVIGGGSFTLTSGQSQSVTVRFSPTAVQSYSRM